MPINFVPRENQIKLPGAGAINDSWRQQLDAYKSAASGAPQGGGFREFEEGQLMKVESGRVEVSGDELIPNLIKQPAYAIEAPLRPLNQFTGGGFGDTLASVWNAAKSVPVLGAPFHAAEGFVGVLDTSNKAGKAWMNWRLAQQLADVAGRPEGYVSSLWGQTRTAGEIRRLALSRWAVNPTTGQEFNLQQLEARAKQDPWNFGEFDVNENGFVNFAAQVLGDPLNVALLGSGAMLQGARAGARVLTAADWAKPAVNLGTRMAGAPRIGVGALQSLGRYTEATRYGAKFLDEYSAARAAIGGQLATHSTTAGVLRASAWIMRGLYMPGYGTSVGRAVDKAGRQAIGEAVSGAGRGALSLGGAVAATGRAASAAAQGASRVTTGMKVEAGATAWMRGGIQQQVVTNVTEQLAGVANGFVIEQGLGGTEIDGFTGWLHDTMESLNNDHFLSDNDAFTIAALFSPWAPAIGSIPRAVGRTQRTRDLPKYAARTLFEVKDEFRRMYGNNMKWDELWNKLGDGDMNVAAQRWGWFVDQMEAMKASNQLSNFTRNAIELEDLALRMPILRDLVVNKIRDQRISGALQPKSLADYMIDTIRSGPKGVAGERLSHKIEITPDIFFDRAISMHRLHEKMAPQFEELSGLVVEQGAPMPRELLQGMRTLFDDMADDVVGPRDLVAQLFEAGPSLVWEGDFWTRFSATAGQFQFKSGKFLKGDDGLTGAGTRAATEGEGVTVGEIRRRMDELIEDAPPADELFHESVAASTKATKIKPGETLISEPPFDLPKALATRRTQNVASVRHLQSVDNILAEMKGREFFKNGKPRIQAAKAMTGGEGGLYQRAEGNIFRREGDGMAFTVDDGILKPMTDGFPYSIDSETLVLGVETGGRVIRMPRSEGAFLAEHGFVEVATIKGSDLATYAFRGGDVTQIIANKNAGAFSPYRATRRSAGEPGAINLARKSANDASLLRPSMDGIGPSPTKARRHLLPEQRRQELDSLREAALNERKALVKRISEDDAQAMELAGIDMNFGKLGDWFNHASPAKVKDAMKFMKDVNTEFPATTVREGQQIIIDPRADRFSGLLTHRTLLERLAFDYGHMSPISYVYNGLFAPVNARWLGKQVQNEIHNLLAQSGFNAKESGLFLSNMKEIVLNSRSTEGLGGAMGSHLFRTMRALPTGLVHAALRDAAPAKAGEVLARWGNGQKLMTEAGNRLLRTANEQARAGRKVDPLLAAVNGAFRVWQYAPGLTYLSSSTHYLTKFLYPLFRFNLDPFYLIMNVIEPDVYGISMEGIRATRKAAKIVPEEQSANASAQAAVTSVPPGGLMQADTPIDLLLGETGAFTMPPNMRPIIERHHDIRRLASTEEVMRAIPKEDPVAIMMTERFGDNVKDWAKDADALMYGYVHKGPEVTVREGFSAFIKEMGYTKDEVMNMMPMVERLSSMHRGNYNGLVDLYVGRMNRPNIERIMDHFFLFWPLSYQIKATTWLAGIMFKRIGGMNTNMAPAAMYDEYRQRWEASVENDFAMKSWLEKNDDFTFALEMFLPMTPSSVGVGLSRPTRYVGSWLANEIEVPDDLRETYLGDYENIKTLDEVLINSSRIGPIRTLQLVTRIMQRFDAPGFDNGEAAPAKYPVLP